MSTRLWLGLAGSAIGFAVAVRWAQRRDAHAALQREDERFHQAYDALRHDAAENMPALVFHAGKFTFSDGAQRVEYPASAPASHVLKAAAHAPLGVYTLLLPHENAELPAAVKTSLQASSTTIRRAEHELSSDDAGLREEARAESLEVLRTTRELVEQILAHQRADSESLAKFAGVLGPRLLKLTAYATELELAALHAATEAALQNMTPAQHASFEVVVAGAHQARDRSLPLQYFRKRFGEAPGEEHRVAFAESVSGPDEARQLVGTRRLDRDIAAAFFGNAKRLQRDVLGDAAEHLLERTSFSRIVAPQREADSTATHQRSRPTREATSDVTE